MEASCLEIWSDGWESSLHYKELGEFSTVPENPKAVLTYTLNRTHNRIRSPRFVASGQ